MYNKLGDVMKKRSFYISFILFLGLTIILILLKQYNAAIISGSFTGFILLSIIGLYIIDYRYHQKLDNKYYVLTKDYIVKEYEKLTKQKDEGKLKAVSILYIVLIGNYPDDVLKAFGKFLDESFKIDPVGRDDGYIVLLANIHEIMLTEMVKQFKDKLNETNIKVQFRFGAAYYTGSESFETLKLEAKKTVK
jgi:hypothetical protein